MVRSLLVLFFCCIQCTINIRAQTIKGRIRGEESGAPVAGATIELPQMHSAAIADQQGYFEIRGVANGRHPLKIRAAGFLPYEGFVSVKDTKTPLLNIVLKEQISTLDSVKVTDATFRSSRQNARLLEKKSIPLINIISGQSIEQSSDMTMADAIQRASSVSLSANQSGMLTRAVIRGMDSKYSYISINGMALPSPDDRSRQLALDLFAANIIDRLEIYKTPSAEMPGNAIGGWINIITPTVPEKEQFSVKLATGYNELFAQRPFLSFNNKVVQPESPYEKYGPGYYAKGTDFTKENLSFKKIHPATDFQGTVLWGKRFFKNKVGVIINAGAQNTRQGSNSFLLLQNSEPQLYNAPGITDFTKREYSIYSLRRNAYARVDYHLNARNQFQLSQLYTWKKDIEARGWVDTSLAEGRSGPGTGRIAFSDRSRLHTQSLYNLNLQGLHQLNKALFFDWTAVYSTAYGAYPDWAEYTANTGRILGADGAVAQTPVLLAPLKRIWMHNTEIEKAVAAKFSYTPSQQLKITAGVLLQRHNRNNFYNEYIFNPAYTQSNGQPFTDIYQATWYNDNGPQNPLGNTNTAGTYRANENIAAFFGTAKFRLKKMEILAGIRNEHTHQSVVSAAPPADNWERQVKINYGDWLPSVHFRLPVNKQSDLRLSYYRAICRPALYDITFFNIDYDNYNIAGNPFLKHSTADNFDLRYEVYIPQKLDLLQVSVFYKQIRDPYEKTLLNAADTLYPLPSGGLTYTPAAKITEQLRNFGTAYNYGLEISVQKNFGRISVAGNYTFTASHIEQTKKYKQRQTEEDPASDIITVTRLEERPLQGQSKNVANLTVSYQVPGIGWMGQLTGNYTGKRIEAVSGWYQLDNWQKGYTTLNFSMEKTLGRHFRLFTRISNLLNASPFVYINHPAASDIPGQTEKEPLIIERTNTFRQYLLGLEFKL